MQDGSTCLTRTQRRVTSFWGLRSDLVSQISCLGDALGVVGEKVFVSPQLSLIKLASSCPKYTPTPIDNKAQKAFNHHQVGREGEGLPIGRQRDPGSQPKVGPGAGWAGTEREQTGGNNSRAQRSFSQVRKPGRSISTAYLATETLQFTIRWLMPE